jgi:hypothetical protein
MKKFILLGTCILISLCAIPQTRVILSKEARDRSSAKVAAVLETSNHSQKSISSDSNKVPSEELIGNTWYDLQSNASIQNRLFLFPDGFIGGVFNYGANYSTFPDRGTGYNHFDGNDWDLWPTERIESERCGWPSYAPWGSNGEIVTAHFSGASSNSLVFSKRTVKGVGSWTEFNFTGPDGHVLYWPRMMTGGTNHETIHNIALTAPVANGGTMYEGQDGALVYSRSTNGGASWDIENIIIPGLGSDFYTGFEADIYDFAYSDENTIALLIGNDWTDLILMKSIDNGSTWEKTVIWEHPYPLFDPNNMIVTDTFYCPDGAHSVTIDNFGKVHIAFGINRAYCDGSVRYWFPFVDGVAYWNEYMDVFSNGLNALSPYGDPGSELIEDYNLIGWMQDLNGNGQLDLMDEIGTYYLGASSMPQLVIDEQNQLFLFYSSVTESYDNGVKNYRHIWARGSANFGAWEDFVDLNSDLIHIFDECVFPSCSPTTDENIHLTYQMDNYPGMAVRGDEHDWTENKIVHLVIEKSEIVAPNPGLSLTGLVNELESGLPIEGAEITIEGTSFSVSSNPNGSYAIYYIPAGNYTANCSKAGYFEESKSIIISENNITIQNFELSKLAIPGDGVIGSTIFDLQSMNSMQNRIYKFDDGTIGAAWTMGMDEPSFPNLGTAYNFYNGQEWLPIPTETIENEKAGWPSYSPWGTNGEIIVSNYSISAPGDGLIISKREEKGIGDWTMTDYYGPASSGGYLWPRAVTGGTNHSDLHLIAVTKYVYLGGTLYENMDGALLYSKSTDGGISWDYQDVLLEGINSDSYTGFRSDTYEICAKGNTLAFLIGDEYCDLVMMKSTDNGESFTKTVIWEHPYPLFDPSNMTQTDTFYCSDGAHCLAIDTNNIVHVAFGITKIVNDETGSTAFREVDGIAYWNENMATFSNNLNALSPYGEPGTELIPDYNLIAWSQDINGNGELDFLDDWGYYFLGVSSMPQLIVDNQDNRFLVYSSVTEGYDNGDQNYRHLWARGFYSTTQTWGDFLDLNQDTAFTMSECVFPSLSPTSENQLYLLFMEDSEPGIAVSGDLDPYGDNNIKYLNIPKSDLIPELDLGILSGTVKELSTGYPIVNANISIQGTAFSVYSTADGSYEIVNVPSGNYTVNCEKEGYILQSVNIDIISNNITTKNFQLYEPLPPSGGQIGETRYDLQSNASMPGRIYKYDDGTIAGTWILGTVDPAFPGRGTGYNYYDGANWDSFPIDRIETERTGWPSYTPWGSNGEIVVAHYASSSTGGLIINRRQNKGTGDWNSADLFGPTSLNPYIWPRATSGGNNNNDLHIIALTTPGSNGGSPYQGMDGALLYSRSPNGGLTWDYENVLLDEINSDYFYGVGSDSYEIQSQGNNVAFLVGDEWTDLVLMKSTDNGDSWTKTVVWENPYPLYDPNNGNPTDTFYCIDGAHSLAFDISGKIHVAFGITRAHNNGYGGTTLFPLVDGIGYWNENMPVFSNNLNALNPYGGLGSEMIADYNLIGWSQDINGNGQLDILNDFGKYFLGFSSMPQLVIDNTNNIFLVYSSVTEGFDNGNQNYRHIWARGSNDNGQNWGEFIDLNSNLIYIFSECVFPSLSPTTDNSIHLIFQEDNEPGIAVIGDFDPYGDNKIIYQNYLKSDIITPIPGGILEGTVTDATSASPIEGATISLDGSSYMATSVSGGHYIMPNILPGNYTAMCSKMGYLNQLFDVVIVENEYLTQDFNLTEANDLNPPENLIATIFNDNDVLLDWDEPQSGDPLGYHIYKEGVSIGFFTTTSTVDYGLVPGEYSYFVTAVYDEGESLSSNTVNVAVIEPCYPPENVTATIVNITELSLTWDPPLSGTPIGYNLYKDGTLIANTGTNQIYFDDLGVGTFEFCVTSVCEGGESDIACAETVTIELLPPLNLEAETVNSNVILTWDAPENKSLTGFNVYHKYEGGEFSLFIYVTEPTSIYEDASIGLHEFYVTAIFDEGESTGSNTVEVLITSINLNPVDGILIRPNPALDFVNIKSNFIIESIKVYDPMGTLLENKKLNTKTYQINTSSYPSGLYNLQIETVNGLITKKVVIK